MFEIKKSRPFIGRLSATLMSSMPVRPINLLLRPQTGISILQNIPSLLITNYKLLITTSMPHTKEFIAEMKQQLEDERTILNQEISATSTYPEYGRNDEDNATEIADYAASQSTESTLSERLKNVIAALERIEQGTYGVTAAIEEIPEDRLRANPAATDIVK